MAKHGRNAARNAPAARPRKPGSIAAEVEQLLARPAPHGPKARPAGRPEGAKTSEAPTATAVNPPCAKCGKSALKRHHVLGDVRLPTPHTMPDGRVFTHRKLCRAQCQKCQTWQPVVEWYNG